MFVPAAISVTVNWQRRDYPRVPNWPCWKSIVSACRQRFLPNNTFDTRVVIIGDRAFAFRRYNRPGDFRASGSNLNEFDPDKIDLRFIQIAFQVSKDLGFDSMAYDFIYDTDMRPAIIEISYVFGATLGSNISDCPGYWDDKFNWHQQRMEVSYCILSKLLNRSDLLMPN